MRRWLLGCAVVGYAVALWVAAPTAQIRPAPTPIDLSTGAVGTLSVSHGGTSLTTLTAHNVYVGNGTSAPTAIPGNTNCLLFWTISSSDPSCSATPTVTSINPTGSQLINGALLVSATAPTVAAGFGSMSAGTVTHNTGSQVVMVTVGTNAGGTTGSLTLPSAPTGWACELHDVTNPTDLTRQTAYTQTTAAFSTTVAWTTGDVLVGLCGPF